MPNKKPKIFIIAGEVSGDALGARVMRHLPNVEFAGIGGAEMQRCGLKTLFPIADLSIMGIVEVLLNVRTLTRRIHQTVDAIIQYNPDMVLTVDSPGFARSVIKELRKNKQGQKMIESGLRFHHIVAPQVWAWRPRRAKKYAATFDKLYAFFDFEIPYFTKYGLDTVAVGHPIAETLIGVNPVKKQVPDVKEKIITFVPGSRMNEVKKLMPVFKNVAETICSCGYLGYKFVIPVVETTAEYVKSHIKTWNVEVSVVSADKRYDLYKNTYVAIVASGTVSAELAMLHIPAIVVYKMNPVTTLIGHLLIKVRWVSLVNILLNRGVYPEYLGTSATADNIINALDSIVLPANRKKMIADLSMADKLWMRPNGAASQIIADDIICTIKK